MPSGRKSSARAYFQPTVPLPPQTILSIETELSYFRYRRPLLLDTELRPFSLRNRAHPYQYPIPRRGVTPDRDCLDWPQYPLTHAVGAVLRRSTDTAPPRARSRQPTPTPARSRQPTPARQPTPGPSTTESQSSPILPRTKSVRFPSTEPVRDRDRDRDDDDDDDDDEDDDDDGDGDDNEPRRMRGGKVATPDADGLISKPDGEVGRLTRGYSLPIALGWKQSLYKSTKELVSSYVENYLSHALSESKQPQGHVESLKKLVSDALLPNPNIFGSVLMQTIDSSSSPWYRGPVSGWLAYSRHDPPPSQVHVWSL